MSRNFTLLLVFLVSVNSISILPYPKQVYEGDQTFKIQNLCGLRFKLFDQVPAHVEEITQFYFQKTFQGHSCDTTQLITSTTDNQLSLQEGQQVQVYIQNSDLIYVKEVSEERYQIEIDSLGQIKIEAKTYVGYIRALDSLSQLVSKDSNGVYVLNNLPLIIVDEPSFSYRGVMVDTSRHYLQKETLRRTIDSLMFNKMNVMHWHITDDESFPLLLKGHVEIPQTAAYSNKHLYTYDDIKEILSYAKSRGVQIVPEIDTPGHVWSWGKSEQLKSIMLLCGSTVKQYGQFDPTLELTYEVVESVFTEFAELFKDLPLVHFGGDEVVKSCYDKRPSIKEFMAKNGIPDYDALQSYYRSRQKSIWRNSIKSSQPVAYWANYQINLPVQEDDVIHWWGTTEELQYIKEKKNKIILSNYDLLYLDAGLNNAFGNPYSTFHTWKQIYQQFDPQPQNIAGTVIGAVACLWGETNSDASHFLKLYTRASVLAEIMWNPDQRKKDTLGEFVKRLVGMEYRMTELGYPVMPASSQYCSIHTEVCFP